MNEKDAEFLNNLDKLKYLRHKTEPHKPHNVESKFVGNEISLDGVKNV